MDLDTALAAIFFAAVVAAAPQSSSLSAPTDRPPPPSPSPTASNTPPTPSPTPAQSPNAAAIAGGVVAGVCAVGVVILVVFLLVKHLRRRREAKRLKENAELAESEDPNRPSSLTASGERDEKRYSSQTASSFESKRRATTPAAPVAVSKAQRIPFPDAPTPSPSTTDGRKIKRFSAGSAHSATRTFGTLTPSLQSHASVTTPVVINTSTATRGPVSVPSKALAPPPPPPSKRYSEPIPATVALAAVNPESDLTRRLSLISPTSRTLHPIPPSPRTPPDAGLNTSGKSAVTPSSTLFGSLQGRESSTSSSSLSSMSFIASPTLISPSPNPAPHPASLAVPAANPTPHTIPTIETRSPSFSLKRSLSSKRTPPALIPTQAMLAPVKLEILDTNTASPRLSPLSPLTFPDVPPRPAIVTPESAISGARWPPTSFVSHSSAPSSSAHSTSSSTSMPSMPPLSAVTAFPPPIPPPVPPPPQQFPPDSPRSFKSQNSTEESYSTAASVYASAAPSPTWSIGMSSVFEAAQSSLGHGHGYGHSRGHSYGHTMYMGAPTTVFPGPSVEHLQDE